MKKLKRKEWVIALILLFLLSTFLKLFGSINKVMASSELGFSTLLGGSNIDSISDIATDDQGYSYIIGDTISSNLPVLNAFQQHIGGNSDAFVAKITPQGDLVYLTYLGGSGSDNGRSITVDKLGNVFVVGSTKSYNFPVLNAYKIITEEVLTMSLFQRYRAVVT